MKPVLVFVGCLVGHVVVDGLIPSPWWVPDLTGVGLVIAVARAPRSWLAFSVLAGLLVSPWAVRFAGPLFIAYLGVGRTLRFLADQWDTTDLRVECLIVSAVALALTGGLVWLDDLWSPPILGLTVIHVAVTCLALVIVRQLMVVGH